MKNIIKITIGATFAFMLLLSGSSAFAQENTQLLEKRITELRKTHTELKTQIIDGKITKEYAHEQWQILINKLRAEKDNFFDKKMDEAKEKFQVLSEKYPERAQLLNEKFEMVQLRRMEAREKRLEIRNMIESGEITRSDGGEMRTEFMNTQKELYFKSNKSFAERQGELGKTRE